MGTATHEHARTREALNEMRGDALIETQSEATRCHTWENTLCQFSGISKTQDLGEYVGCMSLYLDFGFDALECCQSESLLCQLAVSTVWQGPKAPFRQQPRCPSELFSVFTCDLCRSSSGALSVVIVCVVGTTLASGGFPEG